MFRIERHQIVVQIFVVGIERGFVAHPVAELVAQSGNCGTPCGVVVDVAQYQRVFCKSRDCLADISHGVKHNTVVAVVVAEAFSRKKVDETLEHVASGIAAGYSCYVLWRIAPLEERVAQFVAVGVVLKADGVIPFAVQLIVNLHAVALCNLFRYAALGQIAEQRGRLQPGYFHIFKRRFFDKRHRFVRFCHGHIHLFGDVPCLLNEISLTRHYSGEREDVATFACAEIVSIWEQHCLGLISANR